MSRKEIYDFLLNFNPYRDNLNDKRSIFIEQLKEKGDKNKIYNEITQIIRNYIYLEYIATLPLKKKQKLSKAAKAAILPAIYEVFLIKKPQHIVNEWVKLIRAKKERAFVNWVLREILRQTDGDLKGIPLPNSAIKKLAIKYSFPVELTVKISQQLSKKEAEKIFKLSFNEVQSVFMPNKLKNIDENFNCKEILPNIYEVCNYEKILPYSKNGDLIIFDKSSFYPIQMLLPLNDKEYILDLCGAPGNKSFMIKNINPNINLYINELQKNRFLLLKENIKKWNIDAQLFNENGMKIHFEEKFDKIIIDAPCTNLGVIANKPDVKYNFSYSRLEKLKISQLNLVKNALKLLKKDGILVYAVCSFLDDEIDPIYDYLNKLENIKIDMDDMPMNLSAYYNGRYIKIIPNENEPIGFQILRVRKI